MSRDESGFLTEVQDAHPPVVGCWPTQWDVRDGRRQAGLTVPSIALDTSRTTRMRSAQIFMPNHMAQLLRKGQVEVIKTMTQSAGVIATASVALAIGMGSLFAAAEPVWICCNLLSECGDKQVCCPPEILNLPPCDDEVHGYCVSLCVRVGKDE